MVTLLVALLFLIVSVQPVAAQKAPEGFQVELLDQAPGVEHPSVVTCDDAGNLFVGEDPMDMRGPSTEPIDRILYYRFGAPGEAPRKTVFCQGLSAVFGMVWLDGALYVMHAPHYTMFRDTDGDGVADVRRDLADGFGPPAGVFGFNDHIVTGTRLGMDGLIYVSVGDKGIQRATGADGSTITLEGGGVVRMRPDGTQLEVVTSGTRNHLDVAMDALDNIFTYDNTDDGLGWWTRFTHHVPSGYYGYPYDYHDHPQRHLPRISEHGGGSPTGAACYRGAIWPKPYQGAAFHCEWGKQKVQWFRLRKQGASFEADMEDFLVPDGSGDFRPSDLCFSPDGRHMYVADWNFPGWVQPKRVGRLYRVTYVGDDAGKEPPRADHSAPLERQLQALSHPDHSERMRAQRAVVAQGASAVEPLTALLNKDSHNEASSKFAAVHGIWAQNGLIDDLADYDPTGDWIKRLKDSDPDVRGQAARALGYRRAKQATGALEAALKDTDAGVRMRAAFALGRIAAPGSSDALWAALSEPDPYARHTMIQALRRINSWDGAREALTNPEELIREAALVTLTGVYDPVAVAVLGQVAQSATRPEVRQAAVGALAEVVRKADPYTSGWWGTQPARNQPREKKNDWEATAVVVETLAAALSDEEPSVRATVVQAIGQIGEPRLLAPVRALITSDPSQQVRSQALKTVARLKDEAAVAEVAQVASASDTEPALRDEAIRTLSEIGSQGAVRHLVKVVHDPQASEPLVNLCLEAVARLKVKEAAPDVDQRIDDPRPAVRAVALNALAQIQGPAAARRIAAALSDQEVSVRQAALIALGQLKSRATVPAMISAAADPAVRFEAIRALAGVPDPRALGLYLQGLVDKNLDTRSACRGALVSIRSEIAEDVLELARRNELPSQVRRELQSVYSVPVPIQHWQGVGAWAKEETLPEMDHAAAPDLTVEYTLGDRKLRWKKLATDDPQGRIQPARAFHPTTESWAVAYAAIEAPAAGPSELIIGSDDQLWVWLNGEKVYQYDGPRGWDPNQAKVPVQLKSGTNHLWIQSGNDGGPWDFSVGYRREDPRFASLGRDAPRKLEPEAYRGFAMKRPGDPERGQRLFADLKGVGCIKCHAVAGQGGNIGPDLVGVGAKYPREELIRSLLEPSNRILSGYVLTIVVTDEGQILQGIVQSQTEKELVLLDAEGKTIQIPKDTIDEMQQSNLSMMPNGLKDGLTLEEFADVIAYLESLKQTPSGTGK